MDTNVFISRFKSDDPYHKEASAIIRSLEKGELVAETSVFTILEVASVSGRLYRKSRNETVLDKKRAFVIKMIRKLGLLRPNFINIPGDKHVSIKGVQAILPSAFDEGILLSLECNLKTLDLIHLAAARYSKRMNNKLAAFVTGDEGFLSDKARLSGIIDMPILSPKEYVDSFGI